MILFLLALASPGPAPIEETTDSPIEDTTEAPIECPDDQPDAYGCGCGEELVIQPYPYEDTQCCAHSPNVGCGCGIKRDAATGCCPDDTRVPTFSDANPGGKIAVH